MTLTLKDLFSDEGLLSQKKNDYRFRPGQYSMAADIAKVFSDEYEETHLAVEAPTGIGKSFAYLIPAISHATRTGQKVVIATSTIALQEQIIEKDIPFLQSVLPRPFKAVKVKGRDNYISKRRFRNYKEDFENPEVRTTFDQVIDEEKVLDELIEIALLIKEDKFIEGGKADFKTLPIFYEDIKSDRYDCDGKHCEFHSECYYYNNRKLLETADIIIANHHIIAIDIAIGGHLLPDYSYLVVDEAHNLLDNCTSAFTRTLSQNRFKNYLKYTDKTKERLSKEHDTIIDLFKFNDINLVEIGKKIFEDINLRIEKENQQEYKLDPIETLETEKTIDFLSNIVDILENEAYYFRKSDQDEIAHIIQSYKTYTENLLSDIVLITKQHNTNYSYRLNCEKSDILEANPISVKEQLEPHLLGKNVVMTSATLSTNNSFDYLNKMTGMPVNNTNILQTPFNFEEQCKLYVYPKNEEPCYFYDENFDSYLEQIEEQIIYLINKSNGRTLVIFNARSRMEDIFYKVQAKFYNTNINFLIQEQDSNKNLLIQQFIEDEHSVLFGLDTMREGIDVKGPSLSQLIIVKIPFDVPTLLHNARGDMIEREGKNKWRDYIYPQTSLKIKQAFGRLIRSETDIGTVHILDPRIVYKHKRFLKDLPRKPIYIQENGFEF